ncbi:50S ribosomal protein L24e [Halovenus salina]|uniref:50S ribosomal protein L24e n=1 Tax=Halovenus salina TaxID=1510225 RepID=A0ABD5W333_9EURY|nr:50S ribosomal protein L24e [Halovenus salina]
MVQERTCDYTGEEIEPGTGKMYVKTDGTILWFKNAKAEKNYFLGRESRDLEWIGYEEEETTDADEPAVEESDDTTVSDDSEEEADTEDEPAADDGDAEEEETEAEA